MTDQNEPVFRMDPGTFRVQEPDSTPTPAPSSEEPAAEPVTTEPAPAEKPAKRRIRWVDMFVSIVLLVLLTLAAVTASIFALFLAFASDSCVAGSCNVEVMATGMWFAILSPWLVLLLAAAGTIVLIVMRRVSFWIPITGFFLMIALWIVGALIVWASTA
ncbi:hypothetical protein GCM10009808_17050 [Microbacterium sediminicola]|uniref:Integral membrane protein n=1 Tax=Microbacterium sediminicola TaxID=415210 RepID=A0ABN2I7L8_9MICO